MPVSQKELGQRFRAAREACQMMQEEVARHLELSRSAVAQLELGNRAITGLELERLAYPLGRDTGEFFAEEFHEEGALVALFRAHPDVAGRIEGFRAGAVELRTRGAETSVRVSAGMACEAPP